MDKRALELRYLGVLGDIDPEVLSLRSSAQDLEIEHQRLRLVNANTQNNVSLLLGSSSAAPQASVAPLMLGGSSAAPHASVAPLMLGGSSAAPHASGGSVAPLMLGGSSAAPQTWTTWNSYLVEQPDSSADELKEDNYDDDDDDPMEVDFEHHIQEAEATLRERDSSY